ncbi:hypothetical protein F53441_8817 [Fusarium austroafricanum]|uniref:Uncharacterized protein n=1 Tax=Fusarium austroafricanum TaxID=2364996 RepID=A0A8H4KD49_9HYPO|nr:hypothetical protein F53441_8817 [Fusarium austroafricanum]
MKFYLLPLLLASSALCAPTEQNNKVEKRCNRRDFATCIAGYQMSCAFLGSAGLSACIGRAHGACQNVPGQGDC